MKYVRIAIALAVLLALTVGGTGAVAAEHLKGHEDNGHGNDCDGTDDTNPSQNPEKKDTGVNDNAKYPRPQCELKK
ncbi:hypothetical protein [Halogeometricum rufum]|nr:hypothetical protein [Halogeometricum rufum]